MNQPSWYAIFVITGQERRVKERLENIFADQIEFLVPKRKLKERRNGVWRETLKTVYPGYVLALGEIGIQDVAKINRTTGVIRLLTDEHGPQKITEKDSQILEKMLDAQGVIDYSTILVKDSKITVTEGPLVSMEGLVQSVDVRKGRVKVKLKFFGEARIVDLGVKFVNVSAEVEG